MNIRNTFLAVAIGLIGCAASLAQPPSSPSDELPPAISAKNSRTRSMTPSQIRRMESARKQAEIRRNYLLAMDLFGMDTLRPRVTATGAMNSYYTLPYVRQYPRFIVIPLVTPSQDETMVGW
jgi:hypothetical protein